MKDRIMDAVVSRVGIAIASALGGALIAAYPLMHSAFCTAGVQ